MKTEFTALTRPRISSGVTSPITLLRMKIETESVKPRTMSAAQDSQYSRDRAKTTVANP